MRFGTDVLGTYEIGTYGLVYLRLVKPSCAGVEVPPIELPLKFLWRRLLLYGGAASSYLFESKLSDQLWLSFRLSQAEQ